MPRTLRTVAGLLVGFGVAWLGSVILGEYPFNGFLPVIGGFLLGVAVVGGQGFVERGDPPVWAILIGAVVAAWGEWHAAWIDAGGIGPLPGMAWVAMGAAALGAFTRLVPAPRPRRREASEADSAD